MTTQEPKTPQSVSHDMPDTEVIVVAAPSPVFVDSTGRRSRLLRRLSYAFGALVMLYGGLVSVSLAGGPVRSSAVLPLPELGTAGDSGELPPPPLPGRTPTATATTAPAVAAAVRAPRSTATRPAARPAAGTTRAGTPRRSTPATRRPTLRPTPVRPSRPPVRPSATPAPSATRPTESTPSPPAAPTTTAPPAATTPPVVVAPAGAGSRDAA